MAYDEKLADRVREIIAFTDNKVEEKKMFSGLCFMVNDKMCLCVDKEGIMIRLNPDILDTVLEKEGCTPMEMKGKVMKGYVFVQNAELSTRKKLEYWMKLALDYNPIAKASKKKKK